MGAALRYWRLVRIDTAGKRQIKEIKPAKEFFADTFPEYTVESDVNDTEVQRLLLELSRDAPADRCLLAERCLLCFISWQIEQVCLQLEANFGNVHGFSCTDLLPYVLDDDGRLQPASSYQCLSRKVLQSFDSAQSSLTNWTTTRVKQDPALNKFLLELGVYLISDWAILNDTRPKQLERILREFHSLTVSEIEYFSKLLESYHLIYRVQRLQQRSLGIRGKCSPPTTQQLEEIALKLESQIGQILKSETVMAQLQNLASRLRQYRIHARGGALPTVSRDAMDREGISAPQVTNSEENEDNQAEFLQLYRSQFLVCLEQALALVIGSRIRQLQSKKADKAKTFLAALQLIYCQQLPMTAIAKQVGLRAQDAVTRLLKLKEFRADVQQQLMLILRDRVLVLAQNYFNLERIQILEHQIASALDEQIAMVVEEADKKSRTTKNSLFADQICRYIDKINK
ncbi:hypothetical protein WKK05_27895 [Nostoc sp. UHCC 0302]|uniref:hypothetical protein n=1 Tax=Nostoc sp. UHCC 0302 TaxID=3134896 RepID=UPI00311CA693